jgi:inner membrane protein
MEPFTQALLGAATAELVAGRRLGRRALGWGAVVGMSPDLDVVLAPLHHGYGEWLYHRGTTHSLWFGFVVGPALGWALWRWRDPGKQTPLGAWIALCIAALVTHPLLDGFTPYGTQLLAPFSRMRFAWNGVAIVDPFYSVLLGAGVAAAATRRLGERWRRGLLVASLVASTAYLAVGLALNQWVLADLGRVLREERLEVRRLRAYPTILQPWLRGFVAHTDGGIIVGLHSLMDPGCPSWRTHPAIERTGVVATVLSSWEGRLLEWFADGDIGVFVTRSAYGRRVRVEDLRYAWSTPDGRGAWGIEAELAGPGRLLGRIERTDRAPLEPGALARFAASLAGRLPGRAAGWSRSAQCTDHDAARLAAGRPRAGPLD